MVWGLIWIRSRNIHGHQNQFHTVLDIYWEEIGLLDKVRDKLEADLYSFSKFLSEKIPIISSVSVTKQSKWGSANVVGYWLKYFFGTADTIDVKWLNMVCDNLQ
jgi:hypothetical protein